MSLVSITSFSFYNYTPLPISTSTFQDSRCCNKNHIIYIFNGQSTNFFISQSYLFENNTNILFFVMFLFVGLIFQTVLFLYILNLYFQKYIVCLFCLHLSFCVLLTFGFIFFSFTFLLTLVLFVPF